MVYGATVRPRWMADGRFWYSNDVPGGTEYVMVDPFAGEKGRAFDHDRIAGALSAVAGDAMAALDLPITDLTFRAHDVVVQLDGGSLFDCDLTDYTCERTEAGRTPPLSSEVTSPDGGHVAFIRDYNLWVRNRDTGGETQLTTDGIEDFGYATNNAGWVRRDRPVLKWSPDSRKIATFQHDARGVGMMYLTTTNVGHPKLDAWRYPMPEDSVIFRVRRVVLDLDRPAGDHMVSLDMEPDQPLRPFAPGVC